jgi:hypothetical protein
MQRERERERERERKQNYEKSLYEYKNECKGVAYIYMINLDYVAFEIKYTVAS